MALAPLDWIIIGAYVVFALAVGLAYAKKAGEDVDQYFLSGRSLPWWIAGTSMVATSFAADTPLVITGWVRDFGIWKNWLWWCYCGGSMAGVFLFARWWRRGGVMTKAELAELRYGGEQAAVLRGTLGVMHAGFTNTITLCWVLLAAAKIMDVLLGIDQTLAVAVACAVALIYSLMAGFWGVVVTDLVQFVMAIVGAIALAWMSWEAVGGTAGLTEAAAAGAPFTRNTLEMFPHAGEGSVFDASFWTVPFAALCVYLGVSWWAVENVDGASVAVQRIAASRDERQGVLALLWFNVSHYALRPWPWIMVGLASMIVLPPIEISSPVEGRVAALESNAVIVEDAAGVRHELVIPEATEDGWGAAPTVAPDDRVEAGAMVAKSDSERAYVVMMRKYLPVGLLGLVVASLLAAFMSTIDTHVNLAASFFVNDLYRRFFRPRATAEHYVSVARYASAGVLVLAGLMASFASSISDLFLFFLAFLGGVGPVYVLRWLWWRVQASTEITAMVASAGATIFLTFAPIHWELGPFSDGGKLLAEGRLCLVVLTSMAAALASLALVKRPDPGTLVDFYRKVRPAGCWGPVAALAPDVQPPREGLNALVGIVGGVAMVFGLMLGLGYLLLGDTQHTLIAIGVAVVGTGCALGALRSTLRSGTA
jgi:Na+/proline symporter